MPVRSSDSSVLRWPDAATVRESLTSWARDRAAGVQELRRVGYFGSYARGDWGPGSDLDVVLVVDVSEEEFVERPAGWDLSGLPVPASALVYTKEEWRRVLTWGGRFAGVLADETEWVLER